MPPRDFNLMSGNDRPHPGPLPRGEGERIVARRKFASRCCNRRLVVRCEEAPNNYAAFNNNQAALNLPERSRVFLPLLGERAGVRADSFSN